MKSASARIASVVQDTNYQVGQVWYERKRVSDYEFDYFPLKIIGIYPYILLTVDRYGIKQAFTRACAFLDLYSKKEAILRKTLGK